MKRYRLKNDIPKFKAGTEFRISEKGHLAHGNSLVYHKNDLKKHPEILNDWFEEIEEQPKTVWDLRQGDVCWKIDIGWDMGYTDIFYSSYARDLRDIGDLFVTEEEANKELARRKAKVILERDTKGFKPDWNNSNQKKISVYYDCALKEFQIYFYNSSCQDLLYFSTYEDAKASIKNHRQEWLTYLGVKEDD